VWIDSARARQLRPEPVVIKASAASDAAGLAVAETLQERRFAAGGPVCMLTTEI
jgi:hypothetical protein